MTRPNGELISQKSGRCSTFRSQPHRQPLLFDSKYPLSGKNSPPILLPIESNILSKIGREEFQDRDKILTTLSTEDHAVFGEVALFEHGKRTATVGTQTDCTLLEITRHDFRRLGEENLRIGYEIARNITQLLCSRLRKADEDTIKLTTALSPVFNK